MISNLLSMTAEHAEYGPCVIVGYYLHGLSVRFLIAIEQDGGRLCDNVEPSDLQITCS